MILALFVAAALQGQSPPARDPRIAQIAESASARRIEHTIRTLVAFHTRNTLSDTLSPTTGIGAARRWIKSQLDSISAACGGCLAVSYVSDIVQPRGRVPRPTQVVDVVAVLKGRTDSTRYVVMTGHYDSRASDDQDDTVSAPGADDDGSGTAAVIEAARILSKYRFNATIVFATLAGEEQGLLGGGILAQYARAQGWNVEGDLNNDIVGGGRGQNGVDDPTVVRIFSESPATATTVLDLARMRSVGGEEDGPSRQLARYIAGVDAAYFPTFHVMLVYRQDRYGRGGDHIAFNREGFAGVRFTEPNENYHRQHQTPRVENGVFYGDVPDSVDFAFTSRVAALNAASLASLAWAPAPPDSATVARFEGVSTRLHWKPVPGAAGYRVYWRATTAPTWTDSRWVGD
ncbi:MAG TPA: M20/M25/M40 family metallo-hydrolase, partial [Gemmatimonadales bacterium]|nr:M20/M25/M40 family metallo-hydrolase [Gemmatimonadales bacterium]